MDSQGPKIRGEDVCALENQIEVKFPSPYRDFLLSYNGGRPTPDVIDVADLPGTPTDVKVFFGIGRDEEFDNIAWKYEIYNNRYPKFRIIPIASDSGGNIFCFRRSKGCEMEVVYLDRASPLGKLYHVADSFGNFLGAIRRWGH